MKSAAQHTALAPAIERAGNFTLETLQTLACVVPVDGVDFLLGKVQRRLDQRAQLDELLREVPDPLGEFAAQRAQRATGRGLGGGLDEIGDALGLREIELVVQECAAGEFARLG